VKLFCARFLLPIAAPPLQDGALLVKNGRIAAVGPRRALAVTHPDASVVDFGDAILLPPMANAHTHLELSHFPRWAKEMGETTSPATFVAWILQVIRIKRRVEPDRYLGSLEEGIRLSLAAGTGAVGDILSWFPARAAHRSSPLKGRLFFETLGFDPERNRKMLESIGTLLDEQTSGSLQLGLSPHSPYTLSASYLEEAFDFARRRRVPAAIHLGESPEEATFLASGTGPIAEILYPQVGWAEMVPAAPRRTPVAYLEEHGALADRPLLAHGVQVSGDDARRLARTKTPVVLCPRSNARLGVGRAPVADLLSAGVTLALGTDSLASNDSLSLWDELAFARQWFGDDLDGQALLAMATRNGAAVLGLGGEMGALHPGMGCHFQLLRPAALPSLATLTDFLCEEGRSAEVASLYLDGRDVLQKR
jgi:cytosine/adenosine deaminase-related metal-dependent hydrolase